MAFLCMGFVMNSIVSQGIIDAVKDDKITKPIVVRMKGTGSEDAAKVVSTLRHHLALRNVDLRASAELCPLFFFSVYAEPQLQASGLEFAFHDDFNAAAAHAVKAANQGHL